MMEYDWRTRKSVVVNRDWSSCWMTCYDCHDNVLVDVVYIILVILWIKTISYTHSSVRDSSQIRPCVVVK